LSRTSENDFIGLLYDAALGRRPWQSAVGAMADVVGSETSSLLIHDPLRGSTEILGMHCLTEDYIEVYGSTFFEHDLWTKEALRRRLHDRVALGTELVSDAQWEGSIIYNEFLRPRTDAFHLVGGMVHLHAGGVLAIGCHRPRSVSRFTAEDKALMTRLLPHLRRSAELYQRMGDEAARKRAVRGAWDRIADGLVQLNSDGCILEVTPAGEALLAADDGLTRSNNALRAASRDEDAALQRLVAGAARTSAAPGRSPAAGGGHMRISRPSGKLPYSVSVAPAGLDRLVLGPRRVAVLVFLTDPEAQPPIDLDALCELYDLSPAEARVTAAVASGQSAPAIALRLDVTIATVRTLLARAMAKTECHSQLALARMVLLGPAGKHYRRS
jgi:DNA-binding CsgD family transcriptional regulator